jgi:hypothetical protein
MKNNCKTGIRFFDKSIISMYCFHSEGSDLIFRFKKDGRVKITLNHSDIDLDVRELSEIAALLLNQ